MQHPLISLHILKEPPKKPDYSAGKKVPGLLQAMLFSKFRIGIYRHFNSLTRFIITFNCNSERTDKNSFYPTADTECVLGSLDCGSLALLAFDSGCCSVEEALETSEFAVSSGLELGAVLFTSLF